MTEAAGGPSVGGVTVTNPGPRPLLLFEGTVLDGGWQHRALVHDVLVPAGVPLDVPVACVEQGRWHGSTTQRTSRRQVPLAVRGALRGIRREVAAGTRSTGVDQGDVWRRVSRYERVYGGSATSSLVDVQDRAAREVDALVAGLRPLYGQRGVLVGVAGHPVLLEVFDHPRTLAEQWDAIVPGSRGELHPPAPTEPDVSLSVHPALVVLLVRRRCTIASGRTWSEPCG